jgi:hypothetical protein
MEGMATIQHHGGRRKEEGERRKEKGTTMTVGKIERLQFRSLLRDG